MSSYFDAFDRDLDAVNLAAGGSQALEDLETRLVQDVSLCSQMRGFPESFRVPLHRVIARWSVFTRESELPDHPYETDEEFRESIGKMSRDLHSLFHDLARLGLPGFTDNPLAPVRNILSMASEFRVALARADQGSPRDKCPSCGGPITFGPDIISRVVSGKEYSVSTWAFFCSAKDCDIHGPVYSMQNLEAADIELGLQMVREPVLTGEMVRLCRKFAGVTAVALKAALPEGTHIPEGESVVDESKDTALREYLTDALLAALRRINIPSP